MENLEGETQPTWTRAEDKTFESALVYFPEGTPERWRRISEVVPGKSSEEVEKHYDVLSDDVVAICSGVIPLPKYNDEPVRKEVGKKKGKVWSKEEHLLFLQGLRQYGKGDWRSISRNIVKSKTATQVASHAQKYYNRQNAKDKGRRKSIHDITLDVPNPVPLSSSMQHPYEGGSYGDDNTTNVNCNQESLLVTNNELISPTSQVPIHRVCSQGQDSNNIDEIHLNNHSSRGETSIPQHLSSPTARFLNHGGVIANGRLAIMYYQGGPPGCNNGTTLRNNHPISLSNQTHMENGNGTYMNGHFICPQSQFSSQGRPMGYYPPNMIGQSTLPPPHFRNMNSHMGPQLPNSRTVHTPHRSIYMGNYGAEFVPCVSLSDNQVKDDSDEGSNSLPDESPNGPKQASF